MAPRSAAVGDEFVQVIYILSTKKKPILHVRVEFCRLVIGSEKQLFDRGSGD